MLLSRTVLSEQLSRLPHAPSAPFHTTPSTTRVPEEVCTSETNVIYIVLLPFSFGLILLGEWIQEEEDMDKNPVQGTQI
jgi:hypothetical protein